MSRAILSVGSILLLVMSAGCEPAGPGAGLSPGFGKVTFQDSTTGEEVGTGCPGFYPVTANHQMTLNEAMVGLKVRVESEQQLKLWVRFGASNFCPAEGSNEIARGNWSAGTYEIFVGTETQGDVADYTLEIIE